MGIALKDPRFTFSRLSDNPRTIYWMVWFLVGIGLVMVAVVIGLMTWRLGSIRTERAQLERAQEYRIQASNEILSHAALARDDLQSILDETRPVVEKVSAVAKLSALVGGLLESKRDSPAHTTLEKIDRLNRDMEEVERRVRNWRERYMPVWLDMIGQGSMGLVREDLAVMRRAVETREDRHRREQALRLKRWEALPAEDAAHLAQAILTSQRQEQDVELDRLAGNLAELALLAEVLGREERPVKLADLKDSKLRPALGRLGEDIAAIMSRPRADISITQQNVEDLRTALFGSGYVIDEARQVINPGKGGLYAQRESIQSLRHEREEIKESLSSISQQMQSAGIAFSQTVQTDSAVLTGQMEQMLTSTRQQMLLLGGVCAALFFWLAWLISRAIRGQVDALQRSREELLEAQSELVTTARQAGMAEIANNVLHNVGNVLSSVNVSAGVIGGRIRDSKVQGLAKAVQLMNEHATDLGDFLTRDERGKAFPGYLNKLVAVLAEEKQSITDELGSLTKGIDHIKEIVATQQSHAGATSLIEPVQIKDLMEDALRMSAASMARHQITLIKEFANVPLLLLDKHLVLQILINLISNAKQAMDGVPDRSHQIALRIRITEPAEGPRLTIRVEDNGEGIGPENLARLFAQGFTTRKNGHGFGLHSCALAAKEMNGTMTAHSDGSGRGAAFTLELPAKVA